jgi:hypothetical protein
MDQSETYLAIVRRGRIEEAQRILLLLGEIRFGPPDAATRAAVESLNDLPRLEALVGRLISPNSWRELLPPPAQRRRNGFRRSSA